MSSAPAPVRTRVKERPEDFVVDEVLAYAPCGEGSHTFVRVEKRLRTTEEVARMLARAARVAPRDVGYAGRKDRVAVARQWLSVPELPPREALALALPGVRVLEAVPHAHKLRTGQIRENRFAVLVRGAGEPERERAQRAAERVRAVGMPNRFGAQRFGREGDNAERARALLRGERLRVDTRQARFLLSALQAEVFDAVLRSRPLPLDRVERGDLARVESSGGLFWVEDEERENARAVAFEISATGPIFGTRVRAPRGAVAGREAAALAAAGLPSPEGLRVPRGVRLRGTRRPLRVRADGLRLEAAAEGTWVRFSLPPGSYASVLVEELFGPVDASRRAPSRSTPEGSRGYPRPTLEKEPPP